MTDSTLEQKLMSVQNSLRAPKNQYNSFGKYYYRNAEDILEAVKPLNKKEGLLLTLSDEIIQISDRLYVKAIATISDGKSEITVCAFAREPISKKGMDDSQVTGTASSYARKYALNGLYLIDDTKDADTDEYKHVTTSEKNVRPVKKQSNQDKEQLLKQVVEEKKQQFMLQSGFSAQDVKQMMKNELTLMGKVVSKDTPMVDVKVAIDSLVRKWEAENGQ